MMTMFNLFDYYVLSRLSMFYVILSLENGSLYFVSAETSDLQRGDL